MSICYLQIIETQRISFFFENQKHPSTTKFTHVLLTCTCNYIFYNNDFKLLVSAYCLLLVNNWMWENSLSCVTDYQIKLTSCKLDPPPLDSVPPCHIHPEWRGQWLGYTGQWLLPASDLWVTRGKNNLYKIKLKNQLLNTHYSIFGI